MKKLMFLLTMLVVAAGFTIPAMINSAGQATDKSVALAAGTDFDSNVDIPPDESAQSKYELGVTKPDGTCYVVETYADTLDDAISSVTNNCQDCSVSDITDAYMPGSPDFKDYCLTPPSGAS